MQKDSISYDSLNNRPLPKWLTDQKEGLVISQPQKIELREDNSLKISFTITLILIVLSTVFLTVYFFKNKKNKQ